MINDRNVTQYQWIQWKLLLSSQPHSRSYKSLFENGLLLSLWKRNRSLSQKTEIKFHCEIKD